MKLLPAPVYKPIDKDAVIEDLKRKLAATEYERDRLLQELIDTQKQWGKTVRRFNEIANIVQQEGFF